MNRDSVDGLATRRSFLKAGAGGIAATAMTETTLAYDEDDRETPVVIKRDDYGVAHVYARGTDEKAPAFFGYGYAAAEDRLFQLELYRRFSRGTVSEVLGSDWVGFDKQARFNRSGTNLQEQIDTYLEDADREILDAFANGINEYIDTVESGDREFHKGFVDNDFTPERWDREDIAGVFVATLAFLSARQLETFGAFLLSLLKRQYDDQKAMELFSDIQWGNDPGAPTSTEPTRAGYTPPYTPTDEDTEGENDGDDDRNETESMDRIGNATTGDGDAVATARTGEYRIPADPEGAHESMVDYWRTLAEGLDALGLPIKLGSYGLAVHPDRTESSNAVLFGGPQVGFSSPSTMYEVGLHGRDFDVAGVTIPPWPCVVWGHNRNGAFTGTAGINNSIQTFVETIRKTEDGDDYEYKFRGEWYPVEETTETISVKGGDDAEVTIRRTRHGVVINWDPTNGEAVTMTRSYEGRDMIDMRASIDQQFAGNVHEFVDAYQQLNYSINGIWAGESGDIGFVHTGRYPDWETVDWDTRLPADGTKYELTDEDYLYSADGNVPSAINPDHGYLANWNNKPAPEWNSGDLSFIWGTDHRVQRIINLVDNRLDEEGTVSYEFMKEIVYDLAFVDLRAIRYKQPLLDALEGADLSATQEDAKEALEGWDNFRQGAGKDNLGPYPVGFTVFNAFFPKLLEKTFAPTFGKVFAIGKSVFFDSTGGHSLLMRALHPEEAALDTAVDYFDVEVDDDSDDDRTREVVFRLAFKEAVATLENKFETSDVSKWQIPALVDELDNLSLYGMPIGVGDAGNMPLMNRGTQNHFVELTGAESNEEADDEGESDSDFRAENILPPGNSGYIAPDGTKDEHYADQLQKFIDFEYKELRFSDEEVAKGTDSVTKLHNYE